MTGFEVLAHTEPSAGATSATPAVRIERLTKQFAVPRPWRELLRRPGERKTVTALRNVSCTVGRGEFFGLLGPNGAGKTTLFKILSGLILPSAGSVRIQGRDLHRDADAVRRILTPVISDERSLRWRLSARENLELFARLFGIPRVDIQRSVEEALTVVGLTDTGYRQVGAFSTGMRQRLAIARALLARPEIILLDEPTRSLDPISARNFRRFLRDELCARLGTTVLLATHTTEEAFDLCDRVAILDRGRLLAWGPAGELVSRFGEDRYRCWVKDRDRQAATALRDTAARIIHQHPPETDGWATMEITIPAGHDGAARVLEALLRHGVAVAGLERVPMSLADLIERVVAAHPEHGHE